jgi:DNA-binding transcriptional ArsR family regulator
MKKILQQNDQCSCRCIHQDRIDAAAKNGLADRETENLASLFKAMGDPNRLRIVWALQNQEMCVCDLAKFIGVTESAISHQLRLLRQLHLVANRRDGLILYYRLDDEHVNKLIHLALEHLREKK